MALREIVVIGAGIAGASAAAELAGTGNVVLLEQEDFPGYHSTGRSAALFSEIYGGPAVRALSRASRSFLFSPPDSFCETGLVHRRGSLFVAREDQLARLDAFETALAAPEATVRVSAGDALQLCPLLRPDYIAGAVYEADSADVEVHELHRGYLRQLKARGGRLLTASRVTALDWRGGIWQIRAGDNLFEADVIVNAAGAWADRIAAAAGAVPLGVTPCRRTAVLVEPPPSADVTRLPLTIDVDEEFYLKPDAGDLLLSPADETPVEPCDVAPEEWDVAVAIDRVCIATTLEVRRVKHSWAGLRSFAPDRAPIAGFDPDAPGFFWLAGQGGYGIQTAPALAQLTTALISGSEIPEALAVAGVQPDMLSPHRFHRARREWAE